MMPGGLPVGAWLLLGAAIGLGLGLVLAFYNAQRPGGPTDHGSPEV